MSTNLAAGCGENSPSREMLRFASALAGSRSVEGRQDVGSFVGASRLPSTAPSMSFLAELVDTAGRSEFIDWLMDTQLYSIGAYFCDEHPELVRGRRDQLCDRGRWTRGDARASRRGPGPRPSSPVTGLAAVAITQAARRLSPWVPRVLLGLGILGVVGARSLDLGRRRGPQSAKIGGVTDVQGIFGGIDRTAPTSARPRRRRPSRSSSSSSAASARLEISHRSARRGYTRPGDARLEFRHSSLAPNDTTVAAMGAEAAGLQEREWQYVDTFVRNLDTARMQAIDEEFLRAVAEDVPQPQAD